METQKSFQKKLQHILSKDFEYEEREPKRIDWSAYSEAQVEEIEKVLKMIQSSIDAVILPKIRKPGRPKEQEVHDTAKAIAFKEYFSLAERQASGFVRLFQEPLGIEEEVTRKQINRGYYDDDVQYILQKAFEKSNEPVKDKEHSFSCDGTGKEKSSKVNWESDKKDEKKHKDFEHVTGMIGNTYHIYSAFSVGGSEQSVAQQLVKDTAKVYDAHIMDFDAGFVSRELSTCVEQVAGAVPFIYPKKNNTFKGKGHPAWKRMHLSLVGNPQWWMHHYHPRSNSETGISCWKQRFPKPMRRKHLKGNWTEICTRLLLHNFTQLNQAHYQEGLEITFLNQPN